MQRNFMQNNGMKVTRACFSVIIKLSGLSDKFESLMQMLDFSLLDLESTEHKDRIARMVEAAQENIKDTTPILKEWCNATKMRKWLKDKVEKLYGDNSKEEEKLSEAEIE